jgi:lipoprotein-anchoring transpeptidase ErfK/SrfK
MAQENRQDVMDRLWRGLLVPLAAICMMAALPATPAAAAKIAVTVDVSQQRMYVAIGGRPTYQWSVSTGRPGFRTPTGSYRPFRMERDWHSTVYENAPMPYSIFFTTGGDAIHGTYETRYLGRAVSHGCVRLTPGHARTLFGLVTLYGLSNTLVTVRP